MSFQMIIKILSVPPCTGYTSLTVVISFSPQWFNEPITKEHYWTLVVLLNINEELAGFLFYQAHRSVWEPNSGVRTGFVVYLYLLYYFFTLRILATTMINEFLELESIFWFSVKYSHCTSFNCMQIFQYEPDCNWNPL